MTGLLLTLALLAALAASARRVLRRRRRRAALAAVDGGSRATAMAVAAFDDIDAHLALRECRCGGLLTSLGERSETEQRRPTPSRNEAAAAGDARILRVVCVECRRCEERSEVWFDATRAYH